MFNETSDVKLPESAMSRQTGSVKPQPEPHEVTAEIIYTALNELMAQARNIFELQVNTNEKLINNPADTPAIQAKEKVERPVNSRHFPGFRDICREISMILQDAQRLQEYLYKHV